MRLGFGRAVGDPGEVSGLVGREGKTGVRSMGWSGGLGGRAGRAGRGRDDGVGRLREGWGAAAGIVLDPSSSADFRTHGATHNGLEAPMGPHTPRLKMT